MLINNTFNFGSVKMIELDHQFSALSVTTCNNTGKGKVFPYSLPSIGPGANPGVQAVSPQVTKPSTRW